MCYTGVFDRTADQPVAKFSCSSLPLTLESQAHLVALFIIENGQIQTVGQVALGIFRRCSYIQQWFLVCEQIGQYFVLRVLFR